jgi:hypothetical protein
MSAKTKEKNIIELNVGGIVYATCESTLNCEPNSLLASLVSSNDQLRDHANRIFIDRDGSLFRYILDYCRTKSITLPENFNERQRLKSEADYYKLTYMSKFLDDHCNEPISLSSLSIRQNFNLENAISLSKIRTLTSGYIVVGYRGTFPFGRENMADVKFRKISRILVCGQVQLCREVFGETLNESRDPDHGCSDRYTSRFFLKHIQLEQAFDALSESGFHLMGTCATGANSFNTDQKIANEMDESRWLHYNEFIFYRA